VILDKKSFWGEKKKGHIWRRKKPAKGGVLRGGRGGEGGGQGFTLQKKIGNWTQQQKNTSKT